MLRWLKIVLLVFIWFCFNVILPALCDVLQTASPRTIKFSKLNEKLYNLCTLVCCNTVSYLKGSADTRKPNLFPFLHSLSLSLCLSLSDEDTEASCKTCFWHDPQARSSQWGTHSFVKETDRQFKGSSGWHQEGTVNTPQPSQLAAGPLIHCRHAEIPEIGLIMLNACQSRAPQGNNMAEEDNMEVLMEV